MIPLPSLPLLRVPLLIRTTNGAPSPTSLNSDLTLLVQNDLNWQTASEHQGTIILDPLVPHSEALELCKRLNEDLLSPSGLHFHADIKHLLSDHAHRPNSTIQRQFWIRSQDARNCTSVSLSGELHQTHCRKPLQPLCSQSAPYTRNTNTDLNPKFYLQVTSSRNNLTFLGTRDHLSFRFLGIPYANPKLKRFAYSTVYNASNQVISSLTYGPQCAQGTTGSEDGCLTLNIHTPHLPGSPKGLRKLRPVMVWIHGGGLEYGQSSDGVFDGGNLASRGDVVVVSLNYRLSTLGFLALPDGKTNGNFGLADQITALNWLHTHLPTFGGDPARITLFGQSAGAASVRALLAAFPQLKAIPPSSDSNGRYHGLFRGAIAQSHPGGFGYALEFAKYMSISRVWEEHVRGLVQSVGCSSSSSSSSTPREEEDWEHVLECLRKVPAVDLQTAENVPRYIVIDGTYILTDELTFSDSSPGIDDSSTPGSAGSSMTTTNTAPAPRRDTVSVMFGWTRDDGSDFLGPWPAASQPSSESSPQSGAVSALDILVRSGLEESIAERVLGSGLFPLPGVQENANATWNLWNQTSKIVTAGMFSCVNQATVIAAARRGTFKSVYAYQFDRTYIGWEPIAGTCGPPPTPDHPHGDMGAPYFRCHSGELAYTFGTLGQDALPFRDAYDLVLSQAVVDMWTSFARTYDPNPALDSYMRVRGYTESAEFLSKARGLWRQVSTGGADGPGEASSSGTSRALRRIDSPAMWSSGWVEREGCEALGLPLDMFLTRK